MAVERKIEAAVSDNAYQERLLGIVDWLEWCIMVTVNLLFTSAFFGIITM